MRSLYFTFALCLLVCSGETGLAQELKDFAAAPIIPWRCSELVTGETAGALVVQVASEATHHMPYFNGNQHSEIFHFWVKTERPRQFKTHVTLVQFRRLVSGNELSLADVVSEMEEGVPVFFKNKSQQIHPRFRKAIKKSAIIVDYLDAKSSSVNKVSEAP